MIKTRFNSPKEKCNTTVNCDSRYFCVFLCVRELLLRSCDMLTYAYECIIETEFSYNENEKFVYILITPIRKN